jgi:hypothetical protein
MYGATQFIVDESDSETDDETEAEHNLNVTSGPRPFIARLVVIPTSSSQSGNGDVSQEAQMKLVDGRRRTSL